MRPALLTSARRRALQASVRRGALYRRDDGNRHRSCDLLLPRATIRALIDAEQLADDDLGGFVITPQGRAPLAQEASA